MKLIDIETGIEYEKFTLDTPTGQIMLRPTGKTYEKREGFTQKVSESVWHCSDWMIKNDTHRAIYFLEPLKKVEPMPEILAGDLIEWESTSVDTYVRSINTSLINTKSDEDIRVIWRNGVKIWERK